MASLKDMVEVGQKYVELGWAIQAQIVSLTEGSTDPADYNRNALAYISEFLNDIEHLINETDDLVEARELIEEMLENEEVTG